MDTQPEVAGTVVVVAAAVVDLPFFVVFGLGFDCEILGAL